MKYIGIIISVIAAITVIVFASVLAEAYKFKYKNSNTINVTGNAKTNFESDFVKWTASFSRKSMDMSEASEQLSNDRSQVREFLEAQGISPDEIVFDAVNIYRDFSYGSDSFGNSRQTFTGYSLSQSVSIESTDLDKVDNASREISALISRGVELSSQAPNYYYSKLEDLKLELISEASTNAAQRAENIAKQSGTKLGGLVKADLGIFQITGQHDNEDFSYGGAFNTTSRHKTANVTLRASYRN